MPFVPFKRSADSEASKKKGFPAEKADEKSKGNPFAKGKKVKGKKRPVRFGKPDDKY